ncbi:hypothetical protein PGRAN_02670 [Listeria grandensis FSL F6-0971]|uniref:DUF3383 family protein n=1 Tax=Listeria grandensis FSL F6-0971 TaxID=1265819 RepID=W7BWR9_9LIST|nr:DUF3383 family protein [Listeria grandensis]EUJ24763.1 hypothetical protein PGRAN_02670 [Listeria grandensis FSL F6-0971]
MAVAVTDVVVNIDIERPAAKVGLGRPLILTKDVAVDAKYGEFTSLEALAKTYPNTTKVYEKAKAIFLQKNAPDMVAVAPFSTSVANALEDVFSKSWHFAILADYVAADALAISNLIEEKAFKFAVIQVPTFAGASQLKTNSRTIVVVHDKVGEHLDAAWIGDVASATVGSATWKFRSNLVGITASELTSAQVDEIHAQGAVAYIIKAGVSQTSEGKTANGEFIDALHGDDWVKSTIETRLQKALTDADKVTFDSRGIALLQSELTSVLDEAFLNGIVDSDDETGQANYSVTAMQRSELKAEDILARKYKGLRFRYKRSGAIHSATVSGTIVV